MEPNNDFTKQLDENVHLNVFYDFSKFDGCRKSSCDVPSGTTQGWACLFSTMLNKLSLVR